MLRVLLYRLLRLRRYFYVSLSYVDRELNINGQVDVTIFTERGYFINREQFIDAVAGIKGVSADVFNIINIVEINKLDFDRYVYKKTSA